VESQIVQLVCVVVVNESENDCYAFLMVIESENSVCFFRVFQKAIKIFLKNDCSMKESPYIVVIMLKDYIEYAI
jgi:hypothetical protein